MPEWYVSGLMMDRARCGRAARQKLDRKHDIPISPAGNRDGKTIYIDRHMPKTLKYGSREIDTDHF